MLLLFFDETHMVGHVVQQEQVKALVEIVSPAKFHDLVVDNMVRTICSDQRKPLCKQNSISQL